MKQKKEPKPVFKIGEKVLLETYNSEGIVKSVIQRNEEYVILFKYLVEFTYKGCFGKEKKYSAWHLEMELGKFIN